MDDSPNLITLERAWALLGPERLLLLGQCHQAGWEDWLAIRSTKAGADFSPSTRAQIVHDGAVAFAKRVFPEPTWRDLQGLFALDMGELLCRFKKLDEDLVPRGIPTGQPVIFEEQRQIELGVQLSLWDPQPMVIVGYVLDAFGLSIVRHVLVLRRDGEVIWSRDLPSAESADAPTPLPAPTPTSPPAAEVRSAHLDEEAGEEVR